METKKIYKRLKKMRKSLKMNKADFDEPSVGIYRRDILVAMKFTGCNGFIAFQPVNF